MIETLETKLGEVIGKYEATIRALESIDYLTEEERDSILTTTFDIFGSRERPNIAFIGRGALDNPMFEAERPVRYLRELNLPWQRRLSDAYSHIPESERQNNYFSHDFERDLRAFGSNHYETVGKAKRELETFFEKYNGAIEKIAGDIGLNWTDKERQIAPYESDEYTNFGREQLKPKYRPLIRSVLDTLIDVQNKLK